VDFRAPASVASARGLHRALRPGFELANQRATPRAGRRTGALAGDTRDRDAFSDEARVSTLALDPTAFPGAADLKASKNLGRLVVSAVDGDTDGDHDVLHAFGARSVSMRREEPMGGGSRGSRPRRRPP